MYCPVVLTLSASTFSAALLLFRRSSPEGVAVGVGVGVGRGAASASGETAEQASASAMKVGPKWFRSRRSEVLVCVFMVSFLFYLVFGVVGFAIRYPFPEIRDEVPKKIQDSRTFERRITRVVTDRMT